MSNDPDWATVAARGARRALGRWVAVAVVGIFGALAQGRPVAAFSCMPAPLADEIASSDAIFFGTVVNAPPRPAGNHEVEIDVHWVWKGRMPTRTIVANSDALMGPGHYGFQVGKRMLVLAHRPQAGGVLKANLCSNMGRFDHTAMYPTNLRLSAWRELILTLGPGTPPMPSDAVVWSIRVALFLAVVFAATRVQRRRLRMPD